MSNWVGSHSDFKVILYFLNLLPISEWKYCSFNAIYFSVYIFPPANLEFLAWFYNMKYSKCQ